MTTAALDVCWNDDARPVGRIVQAADAATFRYSSGTPPARRISHGLPVDDARDWPITFFENLLPDGVQRERLARRLGVSDSSTFAMLRAVGGDFAGALSLLPEDRSVTATGSAPRPLDEELVRRMLEVGVVPAAIDEGLRLSLAGAQDKLPVVLDGESVALPAGGTASTHILKLSSLEFRGVCSNEHFMLSLADAAGVPAAASRLIDLFGREALLVERFDRSGGRRLHQEDVCQALGLPPSRKYEADGGPALLDVVRLLDEASTETGDVIALVRWQAFNVAAGNNDGHNKNLALLREPRVRLAPAYDLVCTRAWDQLDKRLAFAVGGVRDAGAVGPRAWERFAEDASLSKRAVLEQVTRVAAAVRDRAKEVAERAIDEGAESRAVKNALRHVRAHATRALQLLESR